MISKNWMLLFAWTFVLLFNNPLTYLIVKEDWYIVQILWFMSIVGFPIFITLNLFISKSDFFKFFKMFFLSLIGIVLLYLIEMISTNIPFSRKVNSDIDLKIGLLIWIVMWSIFIFKNKFLNKMTKEQKIKVYLWPVSIVLLIIWGGYMLDFIRYLKGPGNWP
jgi:hypothetical protein